jgi:hypothetical protein
MLLQNKSIDKTFYFMLLQNSSINKPIYSALLNNRKSSMKYFDQSDLLLNHVNDYPL